MQNENDIKEIWRDVEGYEGLYQVSSLGRVKSLGNDKTRKEKILLPGTNGKGYLFVNLHKDGIRKKCYVHRLVANAFIPNTNNLSCVNHKDENPSNNVVDNLEWCTYQYNNTYGTCIQRRVANTDYKAIAAKIDYKAIAEKQSRKVYQYDKDGTLIKIWESTKEAGRNGYNQGNISQCCNGELKTHRGYIWSYHPIN